MNFKFKAAVGGALILMMSSQYASAAIALDRTRVIFNGSDKSLALNIENKNKELPYLAQAWLENEKGEKITSPFAILPPIQRVEPGAKSQIKLQGLPALKSEPQDRESVYYFNLREIPPRSDKPNTLQIALQTRIKLFYRPSGIAVKTSDKPWQEKITLSNQNGKYVVNNPTPYFVTLVGAKKSASGTVLSNFTPLMVPPKGQAELSVSASALGSSPVLTYVNDYGGRPDLTFSCNGSTCNVASATK
ncbi:molecular chaperone [Serratia proteamaculans]|uniref:fimbria/pilus periplasmic chaperone n=1 Tax=Serratia proteamaculans TaxID=28151 RepID=UPI001075EE93|nr:fimbria/pilus periplasmic chaperone [Serratia proteamaculans]TFZ52680.1 molecular chaperone [Serratia proteamaculans]